MNNILIFSVVLAAVAYVIYGLFIQSQIFIRKAKKMLKKRFDHCITDISNHGFTLYSMQKPTNYKWTDIRSIEFLTPQSLKIVLKNKDEVTVRPECGGRLEFIKKVPPGIEKFDYNYVESYFANLGPCKVCGFKSVENGTCLNCSCSEKDATQYKGDPETYYKEEQLDYFTVAFDNEESVETTLRKARESELFIPVKDWKIYPTRQEIADAKKEMTS